MSLRLVHRGLPLLDNAPQEQTPQALSLWAQPGRSELGAFQRIVRGSQWAPLRIVYLQYASDPITFYDPHSFYREPEWIKMPREPDVSPELRLYPIVTFLQLTLDVAMATTAPIGYGHVYAAEPLYRRLGRGHRYQGLVD